MKSKETVFVTHGGVTVEVLREEGEAYVRSWRRYGAVVNANNQWVAAVKEAARSTVGPGNLASGLAARAQYGPSWEQDAIDNHGYTRRSDGSVRHPDEPDY